VEVLGENKFKAKPQPEEGVTYASKIDKAEAKVDWGQPAETVDRLIRGLSPFPGAWCEMKGERVKLLGSVVTMGASEAGMALDDGYTIACGSGAVRLTKLQRAGKGPMAADVFARGFLLLKGEKLA